MEVGLGKAALRCRGEAGWSSSNMEQGIGQQQPVFGQPKVSGGQDLLYMYPPALQRDWGEQCAGALPLALLPADSIQGHSSR